MAKPDTEKTASPTHTPRTHTPPQTQMETERQTLLSWAELLLPPSPPALTVRATLWQEVQPHVALLLPSALPLYWALGASQAHTPPSVLMSCSLLLGPGSQDIPREVSGYQNMPIQSLDSLQSQASPCSTFIHTPQLSIPRNQFSPRPLPLPHNPAPYLLRSPHLLPSPEKAP